ncbi:hypothetical protein QZH41_018884 [Actinostola sp. cb2023]|nr:hypothetical protein QZH41_018884 [Actinostola sp. cb2023]
MVEISHLSLMPHVARRAKDVLELGAIRSALKLGCGVYIYVITWILLRQNNNDTIDASVQKPFTYQTIIVIITGGFFAIIFHWGVDEVEKHPTRKEKIVVLRHVGLRSERYMMMLIYMTTQNVLNLVQSYFPLYLTQTMQFPKEAIAYFPLLILVSGIVASFSVKLLTKKFSNRVLYCFGCVLTIGSAAWFFFTPLESRQAIYAPTLIMGWGMSLMVVTSLALVGELIGEDKHSSGIIYAGMAFVDKLSLGLIVLCLQESFPQGEGPDCIECSDYVRTAFSVIPGVEALIGFVAVAFFFKQRPFKNFKKNKDDKGNE